MAGLTDYLMEIQLPDLDGGMVNYRIIADNLGLKYEPKWLDDFSNQMENGLESYISHDRAPDGHTDDRYWAYLNTGFLRIASLLYEKYYKPPPFPEFGFEDFRDVLLFELAGMVQDRVTENGESSNLEGTLSYDLNIVANHFSLVFEDGWIERAATEWSNAGYLIENKQSADKQSPRYELTEKGFEHAQDLGEIIGQANGLLLRGKGELFFSVDASHISRLGLELVAKQETAVAELVKNGYDADATNVDLIFGTEFSGVSSLEIFDNGSGMTIDELDIGFMRLSTPNKVTSPRSDLFKRQKAGRKGIGRFAAQRLGHRLVLETTTRTMRHGLRLSINWDEFEAERNLSSVPNDLIRIKKPFDHGTRLTILELRDSWSDAQIERSHRHIAELIQPFPLATTSTAPDTDPGFKASFAREKDGDVEIIADDWSLYFRHALAEIEGQVGPEGLGSWSIKSERFNIDTTLNPIGPKRDAPWEPYPTSETFVSRRTIISTKKHSAHLGPKLPKSCKAVVEYGFTATVLECCLTVNGLMTG